MQFLRKYGYYKRSLIHAMTSASVSRCYDVCDEKMSMGLFYKFCFTRRLVAVR